MALQLYKQSADIFVPDGSDAETALSRTTDLCIAAHQDDIEIMAFSPAVKCFGRQDLWFTGVVVSDGAGSPRTGIYADYTDQQMKRVRAAEQRTAASIGGYSAQLQLGYTSAEIKDKDDRRTVEDIAAIITACAPRIVYTHNLADKHDTHVSVALRVIEALRGLDRSRRPEKVYALEVWRGLDWLCDDDKVCFDTSDRPNLAAALLGVYDSQISGGKRYDSAALGRRLANATFFASHDTDDYQSLSYGMDTTGLMDSGTDCAWYVERYIERFRDEIINRIRRYAK